MKNSVLVFALMFMLLQISFAQVSRKKRRPSLSTPTRSTTQARHRFANKTVIIRNYWKSNKAIYAKTETNGKIGNYEGELSEKFRMTTVNGNNGDEKYYLESVKYPGYYISLVSGSSDADVDLARQSSRSAWKLINYGGSYKIKSAYYDCVIEMSKSKGYFQTYPDLNNSSRFVSNANNQKWQIIVL